GHEAQFTLHFSADGGYADSLDFLVIIGLNIEDYETGDFSLFEWQHSGNADWYIVSNEQFEGQYSARSGIISHNRQSSLLIDYDVSTEGDISFHYKVSSESGYDYLQFYIDNQLQGEWAGERDWTLVSYPVTEGAHTFRWTYDKDGSVSNGSDCGWIDYIQFPISIPSFVAGDANGSGHVNGLDVTYLVAYFKAIGPPPVVYLGGDSNGDCTVNGLDVTYMISYFKGNGPAPIVGNCP
ncbi:MAG: dockerin type I repeat-containing protein, partial [Planctomycetota bacterium]